GSQEITLGPGCNNVGIIIHEIGHALGLWHEQSRPDRDGYIRVLYDNIEPDKRFAFDKRNSYEVDYQGIPLMIMDL
ncbi:MAG: M12 family metallopeptidase, partial [Proteobacteria bacterium]|nr:M12 family metallopeptidase [Pseudomonadota bacterium]